MKQVLTEDESKRFVIEYKGQRYTGYWSLCAVINRALDDGIPMTDPKFYCQVTENELAHIFRSDSPYSIPLLDKRLKVLHEAGQKLVQKYDGSFVNVLKKAEQSAQDLMKLVASEFQSYNDTATYQGNKVAFYKRAQILIADIWACFEGEGLGKFHDIDTITMFADYRIPQVLAYFEVLEYSEELMNKLKKNEVLVSGSQLEVELRGSSIQAVELLAKEMKRIARPGKTMNAVMIDHYIWDYRREHCNDLRHIPYHKIRCIYY
ncbi:queuosine 5'-phosphate N-glycosylase/hydrolase-like isoform X2 [Tubulanus polymorphus]|uniref:queuosine 5'-phosphate N-glycosylase/hydrolase-like isoform X2 n=1 Tax=Tubulanus polymorphus TaxID=672921 RepID=UPI003DA3EAB4